MNINDHIRDLHYNWRFYIDIVVKRKAMNGLIKNKIADSIDKDLVKRLIKTNDMSNISLGLFSRLPYLHEFVEEQIRSEYVNKVREQKIAALNLFHEANPKMDIVDHILKQEYIVPTYFNKDWIFCTNTRELDSHRENLFIYKFFEDDLFGNHREKEYFERRIFNLVDGLIYYYSDGGEI